MDYRSGTTDDLPEIPTVTEEGILTMAQMEELKELLEKPWTDEVPFVSSGSAWEFKMYENGEIRKHRELGFVEDVEPFESIAKLLE